MHENEEQRRTDLHFQIVIRGGGVRAGASVQRLRKQNQNSCVSHVSWHQAWLSAFVPETFVVRRSHDFRSFTFYWLLLSAHAAFANPVSTGSERFQRFLQV